MFLHRIYLSLKYTVFIFVPLTIIKYKAMKIKIKRKEKHLPTWAEGRSGSWSAQDGHVCRACPPPTPLMWPAV